MIVEKTNDCLFSLLKKSKEWRGFDPNLILYLFDHLIAPILNYDCEIWGNHQWEEIEKIHLFLCKFVLNVKKSTLSDGVYAELGRIPLLVIRQIQIVKFANRVRNLNDQLLVKKALYVQMLDDIKGHYNWVGDAIDIMKKNNIDEFLSHRNVSKRLKDNYRSDLLQRILTYGEGKKLRTYALFKRVIKYEPYLTNIKIRKHEVIMSKFRLSSRDLEIEEGDTEGNQRNPWNVIVSCARH